MLHAIRACVVELDQSDNGGGIHFHNEHGVLAQHEGAFGMGSGGWHGRNVFPWGRISLHTNESP